jgi:hypothetical protein
MSTTQPGYGGQPPHQGQPPFGGQPQYGGQPPRRSRGPLYIAIGIGIALLLAGAGTAVLVTSTGNAQPNPPQPGGKKDKAQPQSDRPACLTPANCPPPVPPPVPPQPPVPPAAPTAASLDPSQACSMLTQQDPALVKVGEEEIDGLIWSDYDYAPNGAGDGAADVAAAQDGGTLLIVVAQNGSWEEAIGGTCQGGIFTPVE